MARPNSRADGNATKSHSTNWYWPIFEIHPPQPCRVRWQWPQLRVRGEPDDQRYHTVANRLTWLESAPFHRTNNPDDLDSTSCRVYSFRRYFCCYRDCNCCLPNLYAWQ